MFDYKVLPNVGIEVTNLDISQPISAAIAAELTQLWLEHGIIVFAGLDAGHENHLHLSEVFGELELHPLEQFRVASNPQVIKLPDEGGGCYVIDGKLITGFINWHQDTCYTPSVCKGAILRMIEPAAEGGQTGFADTARAYDELPEDIKDRIDGLEVRMSFHFDLEDNRFGLDGINYRRATADEAPGKSFDMPKLDPVIHPLVATHPESGRKSLSISPANMDWIIGMDRAESDALLTMLVRHTLQPKFIHVQDWKANDMVLWDNRRTIHKAFGWPPGVRRSALRTTLAGGASTGRYHDEAIVA